MPHQRGAFFVITLRLFPFATLQQKPLISQQRSACFTSSRSSFGFFIPNAFANSNK